MAKHQTCDWHPADIKAAVEKAGWNLHTLSLAAGLPGHSCRRALIGPYGNIRGEQVIADLLGTTPESIWPSRFQKPRRIRRLQARPLPVSRLRQKHEAA